MTIFTDISTGQIIHAVEGRSEECLRPFLKLLAKKAKRLRDRTEITFTVLEGKIDSSLDDFS
jgi:hypothetical protein